MSANPEATESAGVLNENRDRYLLTPCQAEKWLVVELCDKILVDTLVIANFEFFSSAFEQVSVFASDMHPAEVWHPLTTFLGQNMRDLQVFSVENPLIWARYLRFEFQTHHGNQFYCPISLIRVHGLTMMEDYQFEMDALSHVARLNEGSSRAGKEGEDSQPPAPPKSPTVPEPKKGNPLFEKGDTGEVQQQLRQEPQGGAQKDGSGAQKPKTAHEQQEPRQTQQSHHHHHHHQQQPWQGETGDHQGGKEKEKEKRVQDESNVFKAIVGRLSILERNFTLSRLYFEEQLEHAKQAIFVLEDGVYERAKNLTRRMRELGDSVTSMVPPNILLLLFYFL